MIIFGPTGQIGSVAVKTALDQGAKVWLAMRDTNKDIPGLERNTNTSGSFEKVQADLQDPETVKRAVETSGAKRAFIYYAHGCPDGMRATIEALKSGGIDFVVFVSSFTIPMNQGLRDIPASDYIPYVHAQVEANLDDVFGDDHYVALRPGAFASNLFAEKKGIAAGEVSLYGGGFQQDNISPADIGRVAGNVLISGPRNGQKKVYIYGPEIRSLHDSIAQIGKVLGKDVKITAQSREEALNGRIESGIPEHIAAYLIKVLGTSGTDKGSGERFPKYDEGVSNVKLYTGKPSTSFDDWIRDNKAAFSTD